WGLYVAPGGTFMFGLNGEHVLYSSTAAQAGAWYHVVGTYNNRAWALYVNGSLEAQTSGVSITQSSRGLALGQKGDQGFDYLNGLIDEAAIYNRALGGADVQALYGARGASSAGPVIGSTNASKRPVASGNVLAGVNGGDSSGNDN